MREGRGEPLTPEGRPYDLFTGFLGVPAEGGTHVTPARATVRPPRAASYVPRCEGSHA
ncbi:hypothetical protein SUDANB176_06606 [Streptomyces sp. enrichment culture]